MRWHGETPLYVGTALRATLRHGGPLAHALVARSLLPEGSMSRHPAMRREMAVRVSLDPGFCWRAADAAIRRRHCGTDICQANDDSAQARVVAGHRTQKAHESRKRR